VGTRAVASAVDAGWGGRGLTVWAGRLDAGGVCLAAVTLCGLRLSDAGTPAVRCSAAEDGRVAAARRAPLEIVEKVLTNSVSLP
jgi:hypothetical protein